MLKLMIVDDEFIVRQGMRKIIPWEELGISVVGEAENVQEAVDTAAKVFPDIIICDIRLPGGEGFTVIDKIKEYHKNNLYDNEDLHDIADNTTREDEINDYLYTKNYEYDDRDFDI